MKILVTAKQRGSVNVLSPVATELRKRGNDVMVYATGNENEAAGFGTNFSIIHPAVGEYAELIRGYDAVVTGISGRETGDWYFLRAARDAGIPVIACQDQDACYPDRIGQDPNYFPDTIALMNGQCLDTICREMDGETGRELAGRARIVGWAAFDNFAKLREEFTDKKREDLLAKLKIDPEKPVYFHATQNIHPASPGARGAKILEDKSWFDYETKVSEFVFNAAADLGLNLVVKPHPKEEFDFSGYENDKKRSTRELIARFGFKYLEPKSCDSRELMLASRAVSAGRSTCLAEACLLDRNTGGIFPDINSDDLRPYPPVVLQAIPFVQNWDGIEGIVGRISSDDPAVSADMARMRKRFSVDGKAAARIADLVENL